MGRPIRKTRPEPLRQPSRRFAALAFIAGLSSACTPADSRLPAQQPLPTSPVVAPVLAGPPPPPAPPPAPPPPTTAAEFLANPTWSDPRSYDRLCDAVADRVTAFRRALATDAATGLTKVGPAPIDNTKLDALITDLGRLEVALDPTLDLMQAVASATPLEPVRTSAATCATRLTALRAELFTDKHLLALVEPHRSNESARAVFDTLNRSGASLPDDKRARLALIQQDLVRLSDAILDHLTRPDPALVLTTADLAGLPAHLQSRATAEGLSLRFTDLADVAAFSPSASTREAARAARLTTTTTLRSVYADLLTRRHEAATLLGFDSWAHYIAAATRHNQPETILKRLGAVADIARPLAIAELAALQTAVTPADAPVAPDAPDPAATAKPIGDLDHTLLLARQAQAPTHIGPWPHRPLPPTATAPETDWTDSVSRRLAGSRPTWFTTLDANLETYAPLAAPRRLTHPARALGLMRQVQLATFAILAHQLTPPITPEALDALYADTLTRFDLAGLYPNDWPTFHQLATATSYHLIVEGLLRAITPSDVPQGFPHPRGGKPLGQSQLLVPSTASAVGGEASEASEGSPTDAPDGYDLAPFGALTRWLTPEP